MSKVNGVGYQNPSYTNDDVDDGEGNKLPNGTHFHNDANDIVIHVTGDDGKPVHFTNGAAVNGNGLLHPGQPEIR